MQVAFENRWVAGEKGMDRLRWHPDACTHKTVCSVTIHSVQYCLISQLVLPKKIYISHTRANHKDFTALSDEKLKLIQSLSLRLYEWKSTLDFISSGFTATELLSRFEILIKGFMD